MGCDGINHRWNGSGNDRYCVSCGIEWGDIASKEIKELQEQLDCYEYDADDIRADERGKVLREVIAMISAEIQKIDKKHSVELAEPCALGFAAHMLQKFQERWPEELDSR